MSSMLKGAWSWKLLLALVISSVALTATVLAVDQVEPQTCLKGLDPVALAQGQERAGDKSVSITRGRFRYLFADAANKAAFEMDPDRYAVQFGGCCGRMGSLAGFGHPDRFLVHDGRIYLFASDQCQAGFQAAPDKHLERDDQPPTGSDAEVLRGRELVVQALAGFGGADKVDKIKTLEFIRHQPYKSGGEDKLEVIATKVLLPDRFRLDDSWHGGSFTDMVLNKAGYRIGSDGFSAMENSVRREFLKDFRRHALILIASRGEAGFRAVAAGRGKVGDQDVEWLQVGLGGATSTLGIQATTGRVLSLKFRGRAPAAMGDVTRTYSDFREVDGLVVPFAVATSIDDKPAGNPRTYHSVIINKKFDDTVFAAP